MDAAGYASAAARPWHAVRGQVTRVRFDSDFSGGGLADASYLFNGFSELVEVSGFEELSGIATFDQAFSGCGRLETIWADGYAPAAEAEGYLALHGCYRLVGGQGFSPEYGDGAEFLRYGQEGVLTDPAADAREWLYCHLYGDGELVLTLDPEPEAGRALSLSGRMCATARYQEIGSQAWDDASANVLKATFSPDLAALGCVNLSYWFHSCGELGEVAGLANLPAVREARYAFASCGGLTEIDLSGFPTEELEDLFYCFAGSSNLETIWADAGFALPEGCEGSGMFYGCDSLVGGAGTAYAFSMRDEEYCRIDGGEAAPGYLTAKITE